MSADDLARAAVHLLDAGTMVEEVPCTRCGATSLRQRVWLADYLYKTPGRFAMCTCDRCGLLYLSPRPVPAALARHYPPAYTPYRTAIQDERNPLLRAMRRRNIGLRRTYVARFTGAQPGRLLDIGASTGIFLDEMRSHGWEVLGIELSEHAATYARTRFGLEVITGELSQVELPAARFDLVTLWDVLEHTYDPVAVLRRIHGRLDQDGLVALTIPNYESLDRRLFGRYWVGYDAPRHLHVFPKAVLETMLAEAGFRVVDNRAAFGGYFAFVTSLRTWLRARLAPGPLLRGLERLMDLHGVRFLFAPLFWLLDRMDRGGVRVIVARKVGGAPSVLES